MATSVASERVSAAGWPAQVALPVAAVVGIVLGLLAIGVDQFGMSRILVLVFSTGLSWGLAAVVLGALSRRPAVAAGAALLVMLSAVVTYYAGNDLFGLRENAGSAALLRAGMLWGALALVGGPAAGLAGWVARFGSRQQSSAAWGVMAGMLMGQGVYWVWQHGVLLDVVTLPALVLPILLVIPGLRRGGALVALGALAVTAVVAAVAWRVVLAAV